MVFESDTDEDDFAAYAPVNAAAGGYAADGDGGKGASVYEAYNAFYDEEMEPGVVDEQGARFAPSDHDDDDDGGYDDANSDVAEREEKKKKPTRNPSRAGKRRRRVDAHDGGGGDGGNDGDDGKVELSSLSEDFESQQSILKWVRTVPGPLQDVIKNQQAMEAENSGQFASGGSMGSGAMISTVFDDGPWADMCDFLGIPTTRGRLYGGIRMSSLKHTLSYILEDDQSSPKISKLLLLVKSMKYVDEEIVAVFHDPTGEIEGYFHRDIVEQVGSALGAGTGVLLRKVSVFTPTDATSVGRRKSYLNIIPRNLQRVFLPKSQVSSYGATVDVYNKERAVLVAAEDADDENHQAQEEEEQRLLQHDALRHASTELSFLSQRQVVHRNPPVRLDPNVVAAAAGDGKGKGKKSKKKDESNSGLGKWQWNQLVQRKSTNATANASSASAARAVDRDIASSSATNQLLPTSRFTALLSRQIATKRRSTDIGIPASSFVAIEEDDDEDGEEKSADNNRTMSTRVRFAAAPVVVEIPAAPGISSADVSENEEVFLNEKDSTPQPAAVFRPSPAKKKNKAPAISFTKRRDEQAEAVDEEDDDDDW